MLFFPFLNQALAAAFKGNEDVQNTLVGFYCYRLCFVSSNNKGIGRTGRFGTGSTLVRRVRQAGKSKEDQDGKKSDGRLRKRLCQSACGPEIAASIQGWDS